MCAAYINIDIRPARPIPKDFAGGARTHTLPVNQHNYYNDNNKMHYRAHSGFQVCVCGPYAWDGL